jgi:hypothetical protein
MSTVVTGLCSVLLTFSTSRPHLSASAHADMHTFQKTMIHVSSSWRRAHIFMMRIIPALGLCRLCKVSQSRTHDALLTQTDIVSAHALGSACFRRACESGSLVHGCPDWGEPGRRDRHAQDSHVTSNNLLYTEIMAAVVPHVVCFAGCCWW